MATTSANASAAADTVEEEEQRDTATYVLTEHEKQRFEKVFSKDAKEKMAAYMAWRKEHRLDDDTDDGDGPSPPLVKDNDDFDAQLWKWAVQKAWEHQQQQSSEEQGSKRFRRNFGDCRIE